MLRRARWCCIRCTTSRALTRRRACRCRSCKYGSSVRVNVAYDGAPVPALSSGRLQSLLAYLLLHRDAPQPRQHLAYLFWPDATEIQARNNLRQTLHQLRHALPDAERFLHGDVHTLRWREDASYSLDVAAFGQAMARAETAERLRDRTAQRSALDDAVDVISG